MSLPQEADLSLQYGERVLAHVRGTEPGPLLICLSGVHGNEPGTQAAAERFIDNLLKSSVSFRGEIVSIAGNLEALKRNVRFLETDLNRLWSPERMRVLESGESLPITNEEERAQKELFDVLDPLLSQSDRDIYFIDLHTTSSDGAPFIVSSEIPKSRSFGFNLPIVSILGLEDEIDGILVHYAATRGATSVLIEGGWHYSPIAAERLEAALWLVLFQAGMALESSASLDTVYRKYHQMLEDAKEDVPSRLEVVYQHWVEPEDKFIMRPGFDNFEPVALGDFLASDAQGPIYANDNGRIFMPLYQAKGNQGFLLTREVSE